MSEVRERHSFAIGDLMLRRGDGGVMRLEEFRGGLRAFGCAPRAPFDERGATRMRVMFVSSVTTASVSAWRSDSPVSGIPYSVDPGHGDRMCQDVERSQTELILAPMLNAAIPEAVRRGASLPDRPPRPRRRSAPGLAGLGHRRWRIVLGRDRASGYSRDACWPDLGHRDIQHANTSQSPGAACTEPRSPRQRPASYCWRLRAWPTRALYRSPWTTAVPMCAANRVRRCGSPSVPWIGAVTPPTKSPAGSAPRRATRAC